MPFITKKSRAGLAMALCALGASVAAAGCSASSSGATPSSDASTADGEAGPPPPLGVPVASCAGCPVCGGVLGSATTGLTYCTQDCKTNADCPAGTGCVAALSSAALASECIKTCTADSDCSGGFICRSDLPTAGSFCWSSYPPQVDAGSRADGASEAGSDAAPGSGDAGPADANRDVEADAAASDAVAADASSE